MQSIDTNPLFSTVFGQRQNKARMPDLGASKRADTDVLVSQALARMDAEKQPTEHVPVCNNVPASDLLNEHEELWNLLREAINAGFVVQT